PRPTKTRRRTAAVTAGLGLAPLIAVMLPATAAHAHGYVSAPPSRQAQCAQGDVDCGAIRCEPPSGGAPKRRRSRRGRTARFGELDDDGARWQAARVGKPVTWTWTFPAPHRTRDYEYYVGGRRVAVTDGGGRQPPATVSHTVDLGGVSGRQKVLAVWNIADTANAFYACVDLEVR